MSEELNDELKPCPFCSGKAVLVRINERDEYYVVCETVLYTQISDLKKK